MRWGESHTGWHSCVPKWELNLNIFCVSVGQHTSLWSPQCVLIPLKTMASNFTATYHKRAFKTFVVKSFKMSVGVLDGTKLGEVLKFTGLWEEVKCNTQLTPLYWPRSVTAGHIQIAKIEQRHRASSTAKDCDTQHPNYTPRVSTPAHTWNATMIDAALKLTLADSSVKAGSGR